MDEFCYRTSPELLTVGMSIDRSNNYMHEDSNPDPTEDIQSLGGETDNIYEIIVREMEDAVFLIHVGQTDDSYRFTYQRNNPSHQKLTGFSEEELRGQTPRELLGDEQGASIASNYHRCVEQGETIQYEETLELPTGTTHCQTKITPITDGGDVTHIIGVARDITEHKERRQKLRRLDRRFETVLETMSAAVFLKDTDGEYLLMNEACRKLFNVDDQDAAGLTDHDLFPPEVAEKTSEDDRKVIERGETLELEEELPTANGNAVRLTRKSPVYNDDGEVTAICGVSTDITTQKQREREITRLKERFELAVEGADLGLWDWDMTTDEVEFNKQWAQMLGYSLDEIEPHLRAWERRVHPDDLDAVEKALDEHIAGETDMYDTEHRMRTADEGWKWVRDIGRISQRDGDGEPVRAVGIHLDIDDLKEYEQTLERQRKQLRQIIDLVPDLIFVKNREGTYLLANETTADIYGLSPDQIEGNTEHEVLPDADDSEAFRKDDIDVIESGEPKVIPEEELTTAEGETRILQTRKIPYKSQLSGEDAVLGYARDVTELKQYEHTLERQRDNLEVLNQIVRHDIRNTLQVMLTYGDVLGDYVTEGGEEYLQNIVKAGREAVEITQTAAEVTDVMLGSETDLTPANLRSALKSQMAHVRKSHERALVSVDGSIPDVNVLADDMLESVFRNVLNNAIVHNNRELSEVTVSTAIDEDTVQVRIADNGPGIPDRQREHIFQEGQKGLDSEGTGMGLYLVQTLVDRYGGAVWVTDNEPDGSVFTIELHREQ
jgi:PAS domain S-box-containing protein